MATKEAEHKSEAKRIDTTIQALEDHVEKKSLTGVSTSISAWIKTLSEHKELHGIAGDLEKLKEAISEKDGKEIASLLTKLGSETTKAADKAEEGEADKIKALGKALSTAAKAISKIA